MFTATVSPLNQIIITLLSDNLYFWSFLFLKFILFYFYIYIYFLQYTYITITVIIIEKVQIIEGMNMGMATTSHQWGEEKGAKQGPLVTITVAKVC